MATIKQTIELDGAQQAKQQLADLANAARSAFDSIRQAAAQGGDVAKALNTGEARQQLQQLAADARDLASGFQTAAQASKNLDDATNSTQSLSDSIDQGTSKFASFGAGVLVVIGILGALSAAMIGSATSAANFANQVGDSAAKADVSAGDYQKMQFTLEQIGATSTTAQNAIKFFSDASENAKDKVTNARLAVEQLQVSSAKLAQNFLAGADGISRIDRPIKNLEDSISSLKGKLSTGTGFGFFTAEDIETQKKIDQEEEKLVEAKQDRQLKLQEIALKEQELAQKTTEAQKKLADAKLVESLTSGKDEVENFVNALQKVGSIADDVQRARASLAVFGTDLSDVLGKGGQSASEFAERFKKLFGEGLTDEFVKTAREFRAASSEFQLALDFGKISSGATFLPIMTEALRKFTELLSANRGAIAEWASSVSETIKTLLDDVFKIFNGTDTDVQNTWLVTLKDAVISLGQSISNVVQNIIIPSFQGLKSAASGVADILNKAFNTNLTAGDIGLGAIISFLLGGLNALALAIAAVFGGSSPTLDAFREKLRGVGIDIDQIKQFFVDLGNKISEVLSGIDLRGVFAGFSAQNVATTILEIAAAFIALRTAARLAAPVVSSVIGRQVSGDALLAAVAIGSYTGALQALVTVVIGVAAATTILVNGLKLIGLIVTTVATVLGLPALAAAGVVAAFTAAFVAIFLFFDQIKAFGSSIWDGIVSAASSAWAFIVSIVSQAWDTITSIFSINTLNGVWESIVNAASSAWQSIASGVQDLVQQIASIAGGIVDALTQPFNDAWNAISNIIDQIIQKARSIAQAISDALSAAGAAQSAGGFAMGGYTGNISPSKVAGVVHGGEYVQPAWVVAKPGVRYFMELLRRIGDLPTAISYFSRGYSIGGFVDSMRASLTPPMLPGYAAGGLVLASAGGLPRHLGSLDLVFGSGPDSTFRVLAPDAVANALEKYVATKTRRSAGRRQSAVGG